MKIYSTHLANAIIIDFEDASSRPIFRGDYVMAMFGGTMTKVDYDDLVDKLIKERIKYEFNEAR